MRPANFLPWPNESNDFVQRRYGFVQRRYGLAWPCLPPPESRHGMETPISPCRWGSQGSLFALLRYLMCADNGRFHPG